MLCHLRAPALLMRAHVSKDRLDVMVLPDRKSFSVDNNAAGYSELVKRLRGLSIAAIGIEPSGG
jgi:hypothetical protein